MFLPLALLGMLGFVYLGQTRVDDALQRLTDGEETTTRLGAFALDHELLTTWQHLQALAQEPPIRAALNAPLPSNLARMGDALTSLSQRNPAYSKVRWIDETGQERVRINQVAGHAVTVPSAALQNMADRYFFTDARQLQPGSLYLSRPDLNMEHGRIEPPGKLMLRMATPVVDDAGRPRGILIINLLMSDLLEHFKRAASPGRAPSQLLLLDPQGAVLFSLPTDGEPGATATSAQQGIPLVWPRIRQRDAGSYRAADGLWTWRAAITPQFAGATTTQVSQTPLWIVVTHLPATVLRTMEAQVWATLVPAALMTLVILATISWLIVTGGVQRGSAKPPKAGAGAVPQWLWSPYWLALTLPFVMVLLRKYLPASFGDERPFLLLFVLPITLSALFGGLGPGLVATAVAALCSSYFVIVPLGTMHIAAPYDLFQWILLIANGALISVLSEGLQRARLDAEQQRVQQAETLAALQESELRLRLAQEAAHAGTWEWFLADNRVYWSEPLWPLYGLAPGQCAPSFDAWLASVHPDDREQILQNVTTCAAQGEALDIHWRVNLPEGTPQRWLMSRGQPIAGQDGQVERYLGIVIDITARKAVEEELAQHRQHLAERVAERTRQLEEANQTLATRAAEIADLYNHAPCGYQSLDATGTIVTINDTELAWLGYARAEVEGILAFEQLVVPEERADFRERLRTLIQSGTASDQEFNLARKDGSRLPVVLNSTVVRDAAGQFLQTRSTLFDNRERKEREWQIAHLNAELARRAEEAEAATRAKSAFLANMSHEIRTPMNAVLGFCYLLEQRPLDVEALTLVRKVHGAGRTLLALINDILDFSKIEAQKLDIEQAPFRLLELLDEVAAIMTTAAHDKALELIITPPLDVDTVVGDRLRLQQVLVNLLGNAIKFTAQGEVELRISVTAREAGLVHLRFTVRDTGMGIASDQQAQIFSAFSQADESISRQFGGTGLGLAISQQLVNLMGGVLRVNSVVGQGSEFWFELPLACAAAPSGATAPLGQLEVLVADDSATARAALATTLAALGWSAEVVESGAAALERALARLDGEHFYDLLLLDWQMPGVDGLAVAQALREALADRHQADTQAPIILMVTAQARDALLAEPHIAAIDGVLSKPVTPSSLYDAVTTAWRQRQPEQWPAPATPHPTARQRIPGLRVLVVDDSEINREVAQGILEADGAVVTLANDGQDAVDWLQHHPGAVDIVLMDIQMPRLDGYRATRRIRAMPPWRELPIVALTAGAFRSQRLAALEAGMNNFIPKPFSVEAMMAVIQRCTGCQPAAGAGTPEGVVSRSAPEAGLAAPSLPGIDLAGALQQWGQVEKYRTYLNKFVDSYAKAGEAIAAACRQGDVPAAAAQAHKLCGTAGTLRLPAVSQLARELETRLNAGEVALETAAALQVAIDQVGATLAGWTAAASPPPDPILAPAQPPDPARPVRDLLEALDQHDPRGAEAALAQLRAAGDDPRLDAIQGCVTDFDFPGARTAAEYLLASLDHSTTR